MKENLLRNKTVGGWRGGGGGEHTKIALEIHIKETEKCVNSAVIKA